MDPVEDELQYDDYNDYERLMIEKFLTVKIEEDNVDDDSEQDENVIDETFMSEPRPFRASRREKKHLNCISWIRPNGETT